MKRNFKWMLVAILTISGAINMYAEGGYTLQRLSNPEFGVGELDGFMPGGVHGNDYTQSMAVLGDEVYIATQRNLGYAWVNRFTPKFDFWYIVTSLYDGQYPFDDSNDGARIIAYNRKTGEFRLVYQGEIGVGYRSAITFQNAIYFGAYTADSKVKPYVLKLDKDGNATKILESDACVAFRANCVYDGHLYFAGAYPRSEESITNSPVKFAQLSVLCKHSDDSWTRVADYKDFGNVVYDEVLNNWNDAPIWDLAAHNGYLYATVPTSEGFVIFRGHQAGPSETPNKYGWYWEEVAGKTSTLNKPGLSDVATGDLAITNLSGNLFEFNGKLYVYNFYHSIMGEMSAFANGLKALTDNTSSSAMDYLQYAYSLMKNPQKVWCLNDATGKFELQREFTQNMLGTLNGRMVEYDGQLYVAGLDSGHLFILLTQFAGSGLLELNPADIISRLTALTNTINGLKKSKKAAEDQTLIDLLEQLRTILAQFLVCDIANSTKITDILTSTDILNISELLKGLTNGSDVTINWEYKNLLDLILKLIQGKLGGITIEIPDNYTPDMSTIVDYQKLLEDIAKLIQERLGDNTGNVPDIPGITDLLNLILERINSGSSTTNPDYSDLTALIELLLERLAGNVTPDTPDYSSLIELIQNLLGNVGGGSDTQFDSAALIELLQKIFGNVGGGSSTQIDNATLIEFLQKLFGNAGTTADYTSIVNLIRSIFCGNTGDNTQDLASILEIIRNALAGSGDTGNILRDLLLGGILGNLMDNIQTLLGGITSGPVSDYVYLYNRMKENGMGFDLMRTSDCQTFEFITRDGLGHKYNYGCPAFAVADDGLYIGTSNSFYGGQLWVLTNDAAPGTYWAGSVEDDNADAIQSITGTTAQSGYYTLDGRRVNGKPAQKGIYIINGKKVSVN